jgi:hypothetical protein
VLLGLAGVVGEIKKIGGAGNSGYVNSNPVFWLMRYAFTVKSTPIHFTILERGIVTFIISAARETHKYIISEPSNIFPNEFHYVRGRQVFRQKKYPIAYGQY